MEILPPEALPWCELDYEVPNTMARTEMIFFFLFCDGGGGGEVYALISQAFP